MLAFQWHVNELYSLHNSPIKKTHTHTQVSQHIWREEVRIVNSLDQTFGLKDLGTIIILFHNLHLLF